MNWQEFACQAQQKGFSGAFCVSTVPFAQWEKIARAHPDMRWDGLCADPQDVLPGARAIVVLIRAYLPYSGFPEGEPTIDAYYPASQQAHRAVAELAGMLREQGYAADATAPLPAKQVLLRTGLARYGRNGLLSIPPWGTRVNLQLILTDAPFPPCDAPPEAETALQCQTCAACRNACPAEAIAGNGRIDTALCLRAQSYSEPIPEPVRPNMGRSILGCDICQRACPRNAGLQTVHPPEELIEALRLERLLAGDTKPLAAFIGSNYARPVRMQARAALIAANLGRRDLLPALEKLCDSPFAHVQQHARWAVEKLR